MTDQWTRIFEASLQTLIATTKDFDLPTLAYTARRMADHAITQSSERERTGADPSALRKRAPKQSPLKPSNNSTPQPNKSRA
jgi:hypothetical protein